MGRTVKVVYHADTLQTKITVDGEPFDTSRINGKEIDVWAYPFMLRKIKWNGFYEEMVEALNGEKEFDLIFEGSEKALAELKEAWEDAPVTIVEETAEPTVEIEYDADALTTSITVNGEPFDTTRINGREIEDWVYPFMMRKIKWDGIFEELTKFIGSESYHISFTGEEKWLSTLEEECPETVTISLYSKNDDSASDNIQAELLLKLCSELSQRRYYLSIIYKELSNDLESACMSKSRLETDKSIAIIQYSLRVLEENYYVLRKIKRTVPEKFIEQYKKELQAIADKMKIEYPPLSDVEWLQKGEAAYKSKDYENAFLFFSEANKRGNKLSSKYLAECYFYGYGVKQSNGKAYKMCKKALETIKNDATLMYMMGYFYQNSIGVSADINEAKSWYKKAANAGNHNAKNALKEIANKPEPIKSAKELYEMAVACEDDEKAFPLLKKSADLGYAEAQCTLATLYYLGKVVEENDEQAYFYYKKAANQNHAEAQYWLGEMYYNGYGVMQNYSEAFKWYTKSAKNGDLDAMLSLGNCYLYGDGTKKNVNQAISWYKKGADQNEPGCQYQLGMCYWDGNGIKKNKSTAFSLFEKSAQQGYARANNKLGLIYHEGEYVDMDFQKAMSYYQLAADDGFPTAMYNLGILYQDLNDVENARKWLNEALEAGFEDAREALENLNDSELEIDINDPMDTTYDLEKHGDFHSASIYHSENIAPYSNNAEKNFIYSLFIFITPECSQKIISILSSLKDLCTENAKYNDISDCYNDLTECYELDSSEETESQRAENAKKITDMIYAYKKHGVMEWILTLIYNDSPKMSKFNPEKFQDAGVVLTSFNNKLKNLISEIKDDFKSNKDKIFTYFVEADNSIIRFMHYETDLTEQEFQNDYSEYEEEEKSADRKGMAACVAGGFFGSLIGAKIGMNYADRLSDEVEETRQKLFQKYIGNFKSDTYMCMIILALYNIRDIASNCISENLDDENGFFDEI